MGSHNMRYISYHNTNYYYLLLLTYLTLTVIKYTVSVHR